MVTYCVKRCLLSSRKLLASSASIGHQASRSVCKQALHTTVARRGGSFQLAGRGVVSFCGRDTVDFLQGLVTSDVTQLHDGSEQTLAQYSMMLNVQGRVLYDLILYNNSKMASDVCFLVECDSSLKDEFIKTVKMYRLRKKVEIDDVSDEYNVWSVLTSLDPRKPLPSSLQVAEERASTKTQANLDVWNAVFCVPDPRVPSFAHRVLLKTKDKDSLFSSGTGYEEHLYRWGIPEGARDLPPGNCLPLESNLSIMSGVSFTKGCYIGQELTARTHHTGVIRKRLMPLVLERSADATEVESDAQITNEKGRKVGKLRGVAGQYGLGLIRLEHDKDALFVHTKDSGQIPASTYRPGWWPQHLWRSESG